jgi:uncharacterized PurR-regulated membrane protein YhhQ (DUF165 family)
VAIALIVLIPISLLFSPLISVLSLPVIGYAVALKSWRTGRNAKDKVVYSVLVISVALAIGMLILFQNPTFQTDWEGGNPLDNLIAVMLLGFMVLATTVWALLGWSLQRVVQGFNKKKSRGRSR